MRKLVIFGNSGSGKSTLASSIQASEGLACLDLDTVAWQPSSPPMRRPLAESQHDIELFISAHPGWIVEGCYSDLLAIAVGHCNELVFMNLPLPACIENARKRPWEPHKYASKSAQDNNLVMLEEWIAQYYARTDVYSHEQHLRLYAQFQGTKCQYVSNRDLARSLPQS